MASIFSGLRFSKETPDVPGTGGLYWGVRRYKVAVRADRHLTIVKNDVKPAKKTG